LILDLYYVKKNILTLILETLLELLQYSFI